MFIDFCVEIIVKQAYRFFILTLFLSHLLIMNLKVARFLFHWADVRFDEMCRKQWKMILCVRSSQYKMS